MDIFSNISGLKGENISTEILVYLLNNNNNFIPFQKLFHQKIFKEPYCSADLGIKMITQKRISESFGCPDIMALTKDDDLVIFENKLGSLLSGSNQLIRYSKIFGDKRSMESIFDAFELTQSDSIKKKYLVLIAPEHIIPAAEKQSNVCLSKEDGHNEIKNYCNAHGIEYIAIPWEEILSDLDQRDTLQEELYAFVYKYLNQKLNEEELMVLKNENIPDALNKLFDTITTMRNGLNLPSYETGRMSQSINFFTFMVEHECYSCSFGYMFPCWKEHKTPVFLHIREKWIKDKKDDLNTLIEEHQFKRDADFEYLLPFHVDDMTDWNNRLVKILKDFDERLR